MATTNSDHDQASLRILVTGADGFIGSLLCPYLQSSGYSVRRAVWKAQPSHDSTADWVIVGDIGPDTDWSNALKHVDAIIHLAGRAHVLRETALNPLDEFRRVNVGGTIQLATMAAENGIKRLVFISSIGVNGNSAPKNSPFTEHAPPAPTLPYAISKWEAEQALHSIATKSDLGIVVVRPPLVYGPSVPGNFLRLLRLANYGFPLPLGNIKNCRSFVSRTNLISFLHRCIEYPNAAGEIFLISDSEDVSTTQLIRKISHHLERPARLIPIPNSLANICGSILGKEHTVDQLWGSLVVDSSKARQLLDWEPPISMDEELALTAQWFKENR